MISIPKKVKYKGRAAEIMAKKQRWYDEERADFAITSDIYFSKEVWIGVGAHVALFCRDGEVIVHVIANRKYKLDFSKKDISIAFGDQVFTNTMKNGEINVFESRCDAETLLKTLVVKVNEKPIGSMFAFSLPNSPYTKERIKSLTASSPVKYDVIKGLYKSEGCCIIL